MLGSLCCLLPKSNKTGVDVKVLVKVKEAYIKVGLILDGSFSRNESRLSMLMLMHA